MPDPLHEKLLVHLAHPHTFLTLADRAFVQAVYDGAARGVGFGFMQQVTEWVWQEWAARNGFSGSAWGPEYFNARIAELEKELGALRTKRKK